MIYRECGAKMYLDDKDYNFKGNLERKLRNERMSDTQLYKQAGNSICVGVLYYIFKELYEAMPYLFDDLKVSSYFSGIGAFESALDRLYADINSGSIAAPTCMSSEPAGGENVLSMMTTTAM